MRMNPALAGGASLSVMLVAALSAIYISTNGQNVPVTIKKPAPPPAATDSLADRLKRPGEKLQQKETFEQLTRVCERLLNLLSNLNPSEEVSLVLATDHVVGPHLGDLLGRLKVDVHRLSTLAQAIQEFQSTNKGGRPSPVLRFCVYRLCTAYSRATGKLPSYSKE